LTTLPIFSDILKEFVQLAALLPSPFIPYPGAKGGRDGRGVNHQPQSLKWNQNRSSVVYRVRGRMNF
jgi:hypothetical protein